ncbi:aldehyde dehydrogenase family protein, partial [bacterium]|nr:aldehyde dehydrogenase family protein [bacterium]
LYYFSNDQRKAKEIIAKTSAGGVCINDTMNHTANLDMPFGGVGESGMGAYHGKYTFDTFTHYKSVMIRSNLLDLRLKYAPYKGKLKLAIIKRILK